jgi:hypothetical protein
LLRGTGSEKTMNDLMMNIIGDTFTYRHSGNLGYSVHQKSAKHLHWVQDGTGIGSVYVDNAIQRGISFDKTVKNYAWLYESKFIVPGPTADVLANVDWYFSNFDLIFSHDQEILALDEKACFVPANGIWIDRPQVCPKTKLISMITSQKRMTKGHEIRLQWAEKLAEHVDMYGRGSNPIEKKEEGLCDYMFSVAIENGEYSSYFTEKILDCFATGTIPVYLGTPDIGDFFNRDGIIVLNDDFDISQLTEDYYYDRIPAIKENLDRVMEFRMPEDYLYKNHLS